MIQRIQTVYLILVIIISAGFMTGRLITYTNGQDQVVTVAFNKVLSQTGNVNQGGENNIIAVTVLSLLIPLLSLITVFLFKNRKIQVKAAIITLCSEILLTGYLVYYFLKLNNTATQIIPGFRIIFPLFYLILTLLAIRGIRKDENLVKSYDRLR